jgi:hypothetical protein
LDDSKPEAADSESIDILLDFVAGASLRSIARRYRISMQNAEGRLRTGFARYAVARSRDVRFTRVIAVRRVGQSEWAADDAGE